MGQSRVESEGDNGPELDGSERVKGFPGQHLSGGLLRIGSHRVNGPQ
jgi:hypothetical protein